MTDEDKRHYEYINRDELEAMVQAEVSRQYIKRIFERFLALAVTVVVVAGIIEVLDWLAR